MLASAVPGLDFVSNSLALSGGYDAESDLKFRDRFRAYINSRSQATADAVGYSIISLSQTLRYRMFENCDATGTWLPGQFLVIVADDSGRPSPSILSNVHAAIDKIRPHGSNFMVRAQYVAPFTLASLLS